MVTYINFIFFAAEGKVSHPKRTALSCSGQLWMGEGGTSCHKFWSRKALQAGG